MSVPPDETKERVKSIRDRGKREHQTARERERDRVYYGVWLSSVDKPSGFEILSDGGWKI